MPVVFNLQNDYLMEEYKKTKVKKEETKKRHLAQMLEELEAGGVYMGMKWNG